MEFNQNRWQCHAGGPGQWPRPNSAGLHAGGSFWEGYRLLNNECCFGIGQKKTRRNKFSSEVRNGTITKSCQQLGTRKKMMPRRRKMLHCRYFPCLAKSLTRMSLTTPQNTLLQDVQQDVQASKLIQLPMRRNIWHEKDAVLVKTKTKHPPRNRTSRQLARKDNCCWNRKAQKSI